MTPQPHTPPPRSRLGRVARTAASAVSTVVTLGLFAALLAWGHATKWSLPKRSELAGGAAAAPKAEPVKVATEGGLRVVRFGSAEDVKTNGIATAAAEPVDLVESLTVPAAVGYDQGRVAQLGSPVPGRVYARRARLGQAVKKGEVLALIDSQEVGKAKADVIRETVMAAFKRETLARLKADTSVVPERTVREAEAAAREADLNRFTAVQRLVNLGFPADPLSDPGDTPEEVRRAVQFLGLPPEVVAELNPRPATANLLPLVAPFDGVVTSQEVVVGEVVLPERHQFTVADVSSMWVHLSARKEDAARLALGQPVEFTAPGLPAPAVGTVDWVSTEVDEKTRTVRARSVMPNPVQASGGPGQADQRALKANLFGSARVRVAEHPGAVVVPSPAVQRMPDGAALVFVRRADGVAFEARPVKLGVVQNGKTQVLAGVRPGEAVATAGSFVLKSELMSDELVGG